MKGKPKFFMTTGHLTSLGISYYFDRELPARLQTRMTKHIVICPRCLPRVVEQRRLVWLAALALRSGDK